MRPHRRPKQRKLNDRLELKKNQYKVSYKNRKDLLWRVRKETRARSKTLRRFIVSLQKGRKSGSVFEMSIMSRYFRFPMEALFGDWFKDLGGNRNVKSPHQKSFFESCKHQPHQNLAGLNFHEQRNKRTILFRLQSNLESFFHSGLRLLYKHPSFSFQY